MFPLGVAFGFSRALFAADFLPHSVGTRVVCVASFLDCEAAALDFGVVLFEATLAVAMAAEGAEAEEGGEGGRPVQGARWEDDGSVRFSRGFLNI